MRATRPAHLGLVDLTLEYYLVRSTERKAPRYVFFSTPLLPRPSYTQISPSAPYCRKLSAYGPPLMQATKFHTHKKQQAKLYFCMCYT